MTHAIHRGRLSPNTVLFKGGRIVRVTPSPTDDDPLHCDIVAGVRYNITYSDLREVKDDLAERVVEKVAFIVTGVDDDGALSLTVEELVSTAPLMIAHDGNWVFIQNSARVNWTPMQLPGGAQLLHRGHCTKLVTRRGLASFREAKIIPGV